MPKLIKADELELDYLHKLSYNKFFDDFVPKAIPTRTYEIVKVSQDGLSFKLIDKEQRDTVSSIHGNFKNHNNTEYFEIKGTYSKFEKRGYLTYLFEVLIYELGYKVLSDGIHSTPGSKEFWQAHIRRKKFNIYRLNLRTNYKRKASKFPEHEIWRIEKYNIFEENEIVITEFDNINGLDLEIDEEDELIDSPKLESILEEFQVTDGDISSNDVNQYFSYRNIRLIAQKYIT